MSSDETREALDVWSERLISLSGTNRLINFRPSKTGSVLIDQPGADEIFETVQSGQQCFFRGDHETIEDDEDDTGAPAVLEGVQRRSRAGLVMHSPRPDQELGSVLRNLMRRANTEFLDRGLSVLYLAFGCLHWRDADNATLVSPLLLVPAALESEGPKGTPHLVSGEDDIVINPALALRLRDFNITLPGMESLDGLTVSEVLDQVRESLAERDDAKSWEIRDTTYLSMFSFAKEAMFRDLKDNEGTIVEHPIVRALATKDPIAQTDEFMFDPIGPDGVEVIAPPEDTPLVLDADSSQRAAVAAAVAGKSFVMDGPPGTGKSQTIANMIGALLHAGKTVLFVSEKAAALDVVRNRLAHAGLDNYLLELHSHKASRKEVATELLRTLDNEPVPPTAMDPFARQSVQDRRLQLNGYAEAMNEIREPLGMSLHRVLGLLAGLHDVPSAPVADNSTAELSKADYREFQKWVDRLERNWRPAAQGTSFLWRDAVDQSSLDIRLYQADVALEQLEGTMQLNAELLDAFGMRRPSDAPRLAALLDHQHTAHPAEALAPWLTSESWDAMLAARDVMQQQVIAAREGEAATLAFGGVDWRDLPPAAELPESPPRVAAAHQPIDLRPLTAAQLTETANRFAAIAEILRDRLNSLQKLSSTLGMPEVKTIGDADRLFRLVDLRREAPALPERRWLSDHGLHAAREASRHAQAELGALAQAEGKAARLYRAEALAAPLTDLQDRFTNLHKGLKKLSKNYRADKKIVQGLLTEAATVEDGIRHLSDAIAWDAAQKRLDHFALTGGEVLGQHWQGRYTNFNHINHAFAMVETALALTNNAVPPQLAEFLSAPGPVDAEMAIVDAVRGDLEQWKRSLADPPQLTCRPGLLVEPIKLGIEWYEAHVGPMRTAAARIAAVDERVGRHLTLAETDHLLSLATRTAALHNLINDSADTYRDHFGDYFRGSETDLEGLERALAWADELRQVAGGSLTIEQVKALEHSEPVGTISSAHAKWVDTRDRIVAAFGESRHQELHRELDNFRDARELIAELREDTIGQQEWFGYLEARGQLERLRLGAAVDFCIEQGVVAERVPHVLERALLRGWADEVMHSDVRLHPFLAHERDTVVDEYRHLDQQLLVNATSEIIRSVNLRRPALAQVGEPAVIRRQGMLKRKHMPVRDLIKTARNTVLAIKPCFMMSPLAVSQYLPSDLRFDVVIFDEASQVTPGDAINCIYRGKSLILAGDERQLPPTSFFERVVEEGEEESDVADFQSVLELAKGCGAFRNLGLRWHYRSRHESLIAFSNYKFYEGKLITYPSSLSEGDDVGVAYYNAGGTYRRGGGADNPTEAAKVAERVIEHYTNRSDLSLGVVTFSVAQADAVIAALDNARAERRDLDRFFDTDDRLNGFFVRSLESVQGDERDVIIFSVGYGPDEAGRVTTQFGVLNKPKGWRRLNVGITRARQRVELVASMRAGEIPPSQNESVNFLRAYIDYAERGMSTLAVEHSPTGLGPESPFEESVLETIKSWGYTVEPQVGAAGFRIDIGVRHPVYPGMFAIGVECDGYQYHSATAARDRDRLRDQILSGLGWQLHRIWGTAWYRDRAQEEDRLHRAIESAIAAPINGRARHEEIERPAVTTVAMESNLAPHWTTSYETCGRQSLRYWVDPAEVGSHLHMQDALVALAEHEGPIHLDLVYERIRDWWNIGRVSYRVKDNVELAVRRAPLLRDGDFIDVPDRTVDRVRTPTEAVTRKAGQVHLDELALAAELLLRDAGTADRKEVIVGVARIFGWLRTGAHVDRRISESIDRLIESGRLLSDSDRLSLAKR